MIVEIEDLRGNPVYAITANGKTVKIISWNFLGGLCDMYLQGERTLGMNMTLLTAQLKAFEVLGVTETAE